MNEMAKKRESTPGENLAKQIIEQYHPKKGSVLFIDEAYSLVDDRNGSFGDEAINTIVQEMETIGTMLSLYSQGILTRWKGSFKRIQASGRELPTMFHSTITIRQHFAK